MARKVRALPQILTLPQVVDLPVREERNLEKTFCQGNMYRWDPRMQFGIVWIKAGEFLPFGCGMVIKLQGIKRSS